MDISLVLRTPLLISSQHLQNKFSTPSFTTPRLFILYIANLADVANEHSVTMHSFADVARVGSMLACGLIGRGFKFLLELTFFNTFAKFVTK